MSNAQPEDRAELAKPREETPANKSSPQEFEALEAAVRATLSNSEAEGEVTAEEIAALQSVAKRHGNVSLTFEPIAIELVEAIISVNYGHLQRSDEVWKGAANKVAQLLFDAPEAHARLENLWHRLVEST